MGVLKKNRRKLIYNNTNYVWYVKQDEDCYDKYILTIVSEDKSLIISYPIGVAEPYIVSKGNIFQGEKTNGCWNRYLAPFEGSEIITPKFVTQLISFATEEKNAEKITFDGKDIWY